MSLHAVVADPRVGVVVSRMKAYEAERVRRLNYDAFTDSYTGTEVERDDQEILVAAEAEVEAVERFHASPEGKYLAAIKGLAEIGADIVLKMEAARGTWSRGWDENMTVLHGMAAEMERQTARALGLSVIAAHAASKQ